METFLKMKNKKSTKKKTQAFTECPKCSETDELYDRLKYVQILQQSVTLNKELLESSGKELIERDELLKKMEKRKLQLAEDIKALCINLEELRVEEKLKIADNKSSSSEKLNEMIEQNKSFAKEIVCLKARVEEEARKRTKLNESWKSSIGEVLVEHNEKVLSMDYENRFLQRQNDVLEARAKKAESELKLKNDQKRNQQNIILQQRRDFQAKIKDLDTELQESKQHECPICFEETSIERKWTAFLPCGHRTCSECADKISALPRNTNRRKCPNCRENINCFLVLEGIYDA